MEKLVKMIKEHEGLRLKPYKCTAGKLTIGYGRNLEDRGIQENEAEFMLNNDISAVADELESKVYFWDTLSPVRKAVLIDMAFNLGVEGLFQFSRTLADIEAGEYAEAGDEMMRSRWAEQVGRRAERLRAMMVTGEWQY